MSLEPRKLKAGVRAHEAARIDTSRRRTTILSRKTRRIGSADLTHEQILH